jgi:hypothetical protein
MEQEMKQKIYKEAKRIEEDCLFSAKGHFCAAQRWASIHLWLGIPAAILAAVAGVSFLSRFNDHNVIAGILAIAVSALTAVLTFVNPNERATNHRYAGDQYNNLRNKVRLLAEVELDLAIEEKEVIKELKDISEERTAFSQKLPLIPWWAYRKAKKGIKKGEAKYEIDEKS